MAIHLVRSESDDLKAKALSRHFWSDDFKMREYYGGKPPGITWEYWLRVDVADPKTRKCMNKVVVIHLVWSESADSV